MTMLACPDVSVPFGSSTSNGYTLRSLPSRFVDGTTVTRRNGAALKPSLDTTMTGRDGPFCSWPTAGSRSAQKTSQRRTGPRYDTDLLPNAGQPVRDRGVEGAGRLVQLRHEDRIGRGGRVRRIDTLPASLAKLRDHRLLDEGIDTRRRAGFHEATDGGRDARVQPEGD